MSSKKEIQEQFLGFLSTPLLWKEQEGFELRQHPVISGQRTKFYQEIETKLRLGKRVEVFLSHLLQNNPRIEQLHKNLQIQQEKITLGELDFIFKDNDKSIHLEAIFKFYLYDPNVGSSEIERWTGPNRKDRLNQKIEKLTAKQLPRLHLPEIVSILQKKGFKVENMEQYVHFQAQLFVPFGERQPSFKFVNQDCIKGFYISLNELDQFKNCQFYIPTKVNWLVDPTPNKKFVGIETFKLELFAFLDEERSPLCWLKDENNELSKFFVVWW